MRARRRASERGSSVILSRALAPPRRPRKCTDVFCCVIFVLFWIGMIVIAAVGASKGNIRRLVYATDHEGAVCGIKNEDITVDSRKLTIDNTGMKYIVYPRIVEVRALALALVS